MSKEVRNFNRRYASEYHIFRTIFYMAFLYVVVFNFFSEFFYLCFCVHAQFSMFKYVSGTLPTMTVSATMTSVTVDVLSVPHGMRMSISMVTSSTS